jgi:hypothetical protein
MMGSCSLVSPHRSDIVWDEPIVGGRGLNGRQRQPEIDHAASPRLIPPPRKPSPSWRERRRAALRRPPCSDPIWITYSAKTISLGLEARKSR